MIKANSNSFFVHYQRPSMQGQSSLAEVLRCCLFAIHRIDFHLKKPTTVVTTTDGSVVKKSTRHAIKHHTHHIADIKLADCTDDAGIVPSNLQ
jgi:hypothetical protein